MALGFLRHLFLIFPVAYAPAGKHVLRGGVDHTPSQLLFLLFPFNRVHLTHFFISCSWTAILIIHYFRWFGIIFLLFSGHIRQHQRLPCDNAVFIGQMVDRKDIVQMTDIAIKLKTDP